MNNKVARLPGSNAVQSEWTVFPWGTDAAMLLGTLSSLEFWGANNTYCCEHVTF